MGFRKKKKRKAAVVGKIHHLADLLASLHERDLLLLVLRMMAYSHEENQFTSDLITGEVCLSSLHLVLKARSCSVTLLVIL